MGLMSWLELERTWPEPVPKSVRLGVFDGRCIRGLPNNPGRIDPVTGRMEGSPTSEIRWIMGANPVLGYKLQSCRESGLARRLVRFMRLEDSILQRLKRARKALQVRMIQDFPDKSSTTLPGVDGSWWEIAWQGRLDARQVMPPNLSPEGYIAELANYLDEAHPVYALLRAESRSLRYWYTRNRVEDILMGHIRRRTQIFSGPHDMALVRVEGLLYLVHQGSVNRIDRRNDIDIT